MTLRLDADTRRRLESLQKEAQRRLLRNSFAAPGGLLRFVKHFWYVLEPQTKFVDGWPIEALCDHLQAITDGRVNRLLANVCPGFMKSLTTDVFWPAFEWGPMRLPHLRYVAFSYSSSLTRRDNRRFGALVSDPEYQDLFPWVQVDKLGEEMVSNKSTGWKLASSIGGVGTGERGNRVILDDPHNVKEAESETVRGETVRWFRESMSNRLNDMEADAIVVIMQRVHGEDVSGVILDQGMDYQHLCYDAETEILTRNGWVKFTDLSEGVDVLGVDPYTLTAEWETPTRYVCERHIGLMISYKSATADMVVTPDHRMVYADSNDMIAGEPTRWRVKPASKLPRDFYLPQIVKWTGLGTEDQISFGGEDWRTGNLADFLGWYLSEGCSSSTSCATRIIQLRNGKHVPDLEKMFEEVPFKKKSRRKNNDKMDCWTIGSKSLATALSTLGDSLSKRAPDVLDQMGPECLHIFLRSYHLGDGSWGGRGRRSMRISTASKRMADDLQRLSIKAGWSATLNTYLNKGGNVLNGHVMKSRLIHSVTIRRSKVVGRSQKSGSKIRSVNISQVPYDGYVYCVSVPSTAILVRRNGRIAVSGNCIPMEYDYDRQTDENYEPISTAIGWHDPRYDMGDNPDEINGLLAWPERFPERVVEALKVDGGPYMWAGQYQQSPSPRGGGIFRREWWQLWESSDGRFPVFDYLVASLDSAFTEQERNDPSALTVWGVFSKEGENRIMLVHAWRKHLQFSGPRMDMSPGESKQHWVQRTQAKWGLMEWVKYTCERFKVDRLLIEAKANGISAAQELSNRYGRLDFSVQLCQVAGSKEARAYAAQPTFSQLLVYAPARDWAEMTMDEMESFPKHKYRDITDSATQAIKHLRASGLANTDDEAKAMEVEDQIKELAKMRRGSVAQEYFS